jgi:hypothetical protein
MKDAEVLNRVIIGLWENTVVVMPREPTEKIILAVDGAIAASDPRFSSDEDIARDIYDAGIKAAESE